MNSVQSYNRDGLDKLKLWLQKAREKGITKYYEILADGKRVIYKTENLEEFDNYLLWMDELTQSLRVMVYNTQNSHRAQIFEYRTEKYVEGESDRLYHTRSRKLNEVEIEERVKAMFKEQQQVTEQIELKQKNAELLKRLSDAEQYIDKLQTELDIYKAKESSSVTKTIEELAKKFFVGTNTGNVSSEDTGVNGTTNSNNEEEPMTCSFKKKTTVENENSTLSDLEKKQLDVLRQVQQSLGREDFITNCQIFDYLANNPEYINTVHESVLELEKMKTS